MFSNHVQWRVDSSVFEIDHSAADMTVSQSVYSIKPGQTLFRKVTSTGEPSQCPIPGLGSGLLEDARQGGD